MQPLKDALARQAHIAEESDPMALWRKSPLHAEKWTGRKILASYAGNALRVHGETEAVNRQGEAMLECGKSQIYQEHEQGMKLKRAYLCHKRGCPICDKLLADGRRHDMETRIPPLLDANSDTIKIPLLLTITIKNCSVDEVREKLRLFNKVWAYLTHPVKGIFGKWLMGALKGLEVTMGEDGSAHPHLHAALYVKRGYFAGNAPAVRVEEVAAVVKRMMGLNYTPHCSMNHAVPRSQEKRAIAAALEAVKYCAKPSKAMYENGVFFAKLMYQLRSLRLVEGTGFLRGIFRDNFVGDEIELEEKKDGEKDIGEATGNRVIVCWRSLSPFTGYYRISRVVSLQEQLYHLDHCQMARVCDPDNTPRECNPF